MIDLVITLLGSQVEDLVQEDSRIDCYPKLVKGESKVVWEWQGTWVCWPGNIMKSIPSSNASNLIYWWIAARQSFQLIFLLLI